MCINSVDVLLRLICLNGILKIKSGLNIGDGNNRPFWSARFTPCPWHLLPPIRRTPPRFLLHCTNLFAGRTKIKKKRAARGFREAGLSVGQLALLRISCRPTVADSMSSSCKLASPIKPYPSSTSSPTPAPETLGK